VVFHRRIAFNRGADLRGRLVSISPLSQESLDIRGIKDFQDIAKFTPGVNIDQTGTNAISIRGISSSAGSGTTGIYIDDVDAAWRQSAMRAAGYTLPGLAILVFLFISVFRSIFGRLTELQERRGGLEVTAHGFRSSFRDWAGEATSFPRELAEAALAHVVGDATERAYRRGDALERRRPMDR